MNLYTLDDKKKIKVATDVLEWALWIETNPFKKVAKTVISKDIYVSTVFLGINHGFNDDIPLVFETMVFGGKHDRKQYHYSTWEEAEKGHAEVVKICKF